MAGVQLLFGPMLIGVFLNATLYGVLVVQTYIYFQTYKRDSPWIKYLILYLFIAETLNTAFDIAMIYEPLVSRWGEIRATIIVPKMLIADAIVTVAISTPVQLFIAWRIKVISNSIILTTAICILAISSFAGGTAVSISVILRPEFASFPEIRWAVLMWLSSSAVADIAITVGLVWSLYKNKQNFRSTNAVVDRIVHLTVQTGAITTIAAVLDFTLFLLLPRTTLNFIPDLPLSKLYTNSLLSTLNARAGLKNLMGPQSGHNVLFGEQNSQEWRSTPRVGNASIHRPKNIYPLPSLGAPIMSSSENSFSGAKADLMLNEV